MSGAAENKGIDRDVNCFFIAAQHRNAKHPHRHVQEPENVNVIRIAVDAFHQQAYYYKKYDDEEVNAGHNFFECFQPCEQHISHDERKDKKCSTRAGEKGKIWFKENGDYGKKQQQLIQWT